MNTRLHRSQRRLTTMSRDKTPLVIARGPHVNLEAGDPDQPFFIASIDKVLIATLIGELIDEGRLRWDSTLDDVLPSSVVDSLPSPAHARAGKDIMIAHLLSHTSGLPDVMFPPRGEKTKCSIAALHTDSSRVWTTTEMLAEVRHLTPIGAPDERFAYGDTGYLALICIAEEARGAGYAELLTRRLFEPSGMRDTASWVDAQGERLAALTASMMPFELTRRGGDSARFMPNLTWTNGLGGASTANDLIRFQEHLHAGAIISAATLGQMARVHNRLRAGIHYGSGLATLRFGGFSPFLRSYPQPAGGLGYTATHLFYYPQQRTHVVIAMNAHRKMAASVREHIRIAGLIRANG